MVKKEPLLQFNLKDILSSSDIYTIAMLSLYTLLAVLLFNVINNAFDLIILNLLLISTIITVSTITTKYRSGKFFFLLKRLYIIPIVFFIYTQVQNYIRVINPNLYDELLIQWDYFIFGTNPTEWLSFLYNPLLTEYLQFTYMLFYFVPLIHGIELYYSGKHKEMDRLVRILTFGFYLSYLLYFILPAVGPRFFIHDFSTLSLEMPGLLLTEFFRSVTNTGGGIGAGCLDPVYCVNRDCMPSGHTMMTIINVVMAYKFGAKFRHLYLILGVSLIFSTVYLRYHYVVDLIVGIFFAFLAMWLEPKIQQYIKNKGFLNA